MSETKEKSPGLTRRSFLKTTAAAAGVAALINTFGCSPSTSPSGNSSSEEEVYNVVCHINCNQGNCSLKATVREGKIVKTETVTYAPKPYERRPCLRGRSHLQWIYNDFRVKYPLRRVEGTERGAGKWERISWDEAIDEISTKFMEIQKKYGTQAICFPSLTADMGSVPQGISMGGRRFKSVLGATDVEYSLDFAVLVGNRRVTTGGVGIDATWGNPNSDLPNAKTIVIWGGNPTEAWIHEWHWFADAMEGGTRLVVVDPRFSTSAAKADRWYPVKIATDTILILGMLNIIIDEGLENKKYMMERTVAPLLVREDTGQFLLQSDIDGSLPGIGDSDGEAKSPSYMVWDKATTSAVSVDESLDPAVSGTYTINGIKATPALSLLKRVTSEYPIEKVVELTGLSEKQIRELIDIYVNQGPVSTSCQYGFDRYRDGDVTAHALITLCALTGNVGVKGGGYGNTWQHSTGFRGNTAFLFPQGVASHSTVPLLLLPDILKTGKYGEGSKEKDYPIKAMFVIAGNLIGNTAGYTEYLNEVLPLLDFIVTCDSIMNDTCKYSDIVLPAAHWFETNRIQSPGNLCPFLQLGEKAIEPLYEAKTHIEVFSLISEKMGFGEFFPPDAQKDWLEGFLDTDALREAGITLKRLREEKIIHVPNTTWEYLQEGGVKVWPSKTGRLEFYQPNPEPRMDWGQTIDKEWYRLPRYRTQSEVGEDNPLAEKYPLVCLNEHPRWRAHTSFGRNKWILELDPEPIVYLSRHDALSRGIEDWDIVTAFNDRGSITLKAVIDDSYPKGMCNIPKGWESDQCIDGHYQSLTFRYVNSVNVNQQFADFRIEVKKGRGGS